MGKKKKDDKKTLLENEETDQPVEQDGDEQVDQAEQQQQSGDEHEYGAPEQAADGGDTSKATRSFSHTSTSTTNSTAVTVRPHHGPLETADGVPIVLGEKHKGGSAEYIKSIVYGGLDGVVSVLVSVASVFGSDVAIKFILALGAAKLVAGGLSMGIGDFLSTQAEVDFIKSERRREQWEVDNYMEGEKAEMVELYVSYGLTKQTSQRIVDIMAKNAKAFVDTMMVEELGLNPDDADQSPLKHGVINFFSFMVFGILPLLVYVVYAIGGYTDPDIAFAICCGSTLFGLLILGIGKGYFTGTPIISSTILTVLCGAASGAVGFGIAYGFKDYGVA